MSASCLSVVGSFLDLDDYHLGRAFPYILQALSGHGVLKSVQQQPTAHALFARWLHRACDLAKSDDDAHAWTGLSILRLTLEEATHDTIKNSHSNVVRVLLRVMQGKGRSTHVVAAALGCLGPLMGSVSRFPDLRRDVSPHLSRFMPLLIPLLKSGEGETPAAGTVACLELLVLLRGTLQQGLRPHVEDIRRACVALYDTPSPRIRQLVANVVAESSLVESVQLPGSNKGESGDGSSAAPHRDSVDDLAAHPWALLSSRCWHSLTELLDQATPGATLPPMRQGGESLASLALPDLQGAPVQRAGLVLRRFETICATLERLMEAQAYQAAATHPDQRWVTAGLPLGLALSVLQRILATAHRSLDEESGVLGGGAALGLGGTSLLSPLAFHTMLPMLQVTSLRLMRTLVALVGKRILPHAATMCHTIKGLYLQLRTSTQTRPSATALTLRAELYRTLGLIVETLGSAVVTSIVTPILPHLLSDLGQAATVPAPTITNANTPSKNSYIATSSTATTPSKQSSSSSRSPGGGAEESLNFAQAAMMSAEHDTGNQKAKRRKLGKHGAQSAVVSTQATEAGGAAELTTESAVGAAGVLVSIMEQCGALLTSAQILSVDRSLIALLLGRVSVSGDAVQQSTPLHRRALFECLVCSLLCPYSPHVSRPMLSYAVRLLTSGGLDTHPEVRSICRRGLAIAHALLHPRAPPAALTPQPIFFSAITDVITTPAPSPATAPFTPTQPATPTALPTPNKNDDNNVETTDSTDKDGEMRRLQQQLRAQESLISSLQHHLDRVMPRDTPASPFRTNANNLTNTLASPFSHLPHTESPPSSEKSTALTTPLASHSNPTIPPVGVNTNNSIDSKADSNTDAPELASVLSDPKAAAVVSAVAWPMGETAMDVDSEATAEVVVVHETAVLNDDGPDDGEVGGNLFDF